MKIVIVGLGKMGSQIAKKLQTAGHEVHGVVRRAEQAAQLTAEGLSVGIDHVEAFKFFGSDRAVIWLMIPAQGVDAELATWLDILPPDSIIIDGGNSDFRLTQARAKTTAEKQVHLLDVGTSGGVHGLADGFSMMVGGERSAYEYIEPLLTVLAQPTGAYQHFGAGGNGHFVKMVHNAIEYGMMQSLAEGYMMLQDGPLAGKIDLAAAGEVWQHGSVITSWLNGLAAEALAENPTLEGIDGYVAESGEARWTLEAAADMGMALPAIQTSFDVRLKSQQGETNFATKMLAAMRNKFGGHAINKS